MVTFCRMETNEKKTPVKDLFLRTIAVLGLIAILLLGAWGIIQLAFAIPSVFGDLGASISSLFTNTTTTTTAPASNESVTVTTPANLSSGQTLEVSWMHSNADQSAQYSYAISYACESGLSVKAPLPTGSFQTVPCNTLFNYVNASEHMNLVPTVTGSASVPLTVTVVATKLSTGDVTASGNSTTTLAPQSGAAQTTTAAPATSSYTSTTPSTTYIPAARPAALYGYGDLSVHFTSVAPSATLTVVKFVIENDGTNVVPAGWTFNATLPINGTYTFGSQPQQALYPGDKIAYTLSFAGMDTAPYTTNTVNPYGYATSGYASSGYTCNGYNCSNNNSVTTSYSNPYTTSNYAYGYGYGYQAPSATITITADPQDLIPELNKGNNIAQTTVPLY